MSYTIEIVNIETREVVKTLGPMTATKADRVERGILINLDDARYHTRLVKCTNEPTA